MKVLRACVGVAAVLAVGSMFGCGEPGGENPLTPEQESALIAEKWDAMIARPVPEWIQDAKFGVYTHWGLYSVGHNTGEWYERHLYDPDYQKNKPEDQRLITDFTNAVGPLDEGYGYKDLLPFLTAEHYDPAYWADVIARSGARYAGISIAHHDNFGMWDSDVYDWNIGKVGIKRDLYGELVAELRKVGVKVAATTHIKRAHGWQLPPPQHLERARAEGWDVVNPEFAEIYPSDETGVTEDEFEQQWDRALREVIGKYQPDIIWFDGGDFTSLRAVSLVEHYFHQADERGQQVHVLNKYKATAEGVRGYNFPEAFGFKDFEHGRNREVGLEYGFTDSISITPQSWGYRRGAGERTIGHDKIISYLIDSTSRGGGLLLSLAPRSDGTLPEATVETLLAIGAWLDVNGEAIFATRKWDHPSDEDPQLEQEKYIYTTRNGSTRWHFNKFTADDVRYTASKDGAHVYVLTLGEPGEETLIAERLSSAYGRRVGSVVLLGSDGEVAFAQTEAGLEIAIPVDAPTDGALAFKVEFVD